jgi:hypothetical protein
MYDYAHPEPLGTRDVIAAWLVCFAIAGAVFAYPGCFADPAREAQAALGNTVSAGSRAELCAIGNRQFGKPQG